MKNNTFISNILLLIFFFLSLIICISFDGTGGNGDTTMHYLFSRWALKHPENLLDHWGKPLFTLFSMPFSQFGFVGIKIFNALVGALSVFLTLKIVEIQKIRYGWFAVLVFYFAPLWFILQFTGLTEHFFSLVLIYAVYFAFKGRYSLSAIVFSFLPFARSEGLIFLGVAAVYFLISRKRRYLPLLLTGHVIYGIIGYFFVHHDFLWVFNKIPYASLDSVYGSGKWTHYFEQMPFVLGWPLYMLLIAGVLIFLFQWLIKPGIRTDLPFFHEKLWLVYGGFGAFFTAHTLFWTLGIFNSMGLKRVMIDVMPLMVLIIMDAAYFLLKIIKAKKWKTIISVSFI
ncbi:MAG: hypothetical protein D6707_08315, partial [Bacteroidetes bacterium]